MHPMPSARSVPPAASQRRRCLFPWRLAGAWVTSWALWAGGAGLPVQAQPEPAQAVPAAALAQGVPSQVAPPASAASAPRAPLGADTPVLMLADTPVPWDEFYFWLRHAARHYKSARGLPVERPIAPEHWQAVMPAQPAPSGTLRQDEPAGGVTPPAPGALADHLLAQAERLARQSLALARAAQAQGLSLSAAEQAAIDAERQRNVRIYGGSEYARIVARMYGSPAVLERLSQRERLGQRLFEQRYGPDGERCTAGQVQAYVGQSRLIYLKYVFVPADQPQAEARVRALRVRLLALSDPGPGLDAAIREHGADEAMADAPDGRLIQRDALGPEVAQAHAALADGQISEVIRTPQGFYLLQRLPITPDVVVAGRSLRYWTAYNHLFKADVSGWADALPTQRLPAFERIDPARLML